MVNAILSQRSIPSRCDLSLVTFICVICMLFQWNVCRCFVNGSGRTLIRLLC
jgi:hypothetical protein